MLHISQYHSLMRVIDAQGDLLRGLQVVETACNIPTALLGDTIEGTCTPHSS